MITILWYNYCKDILMSQLNFGIQSSCDLQMQWYLITISTLLFGMDPSGNERLWKLNLLGVSFVWCGWTWNLRKHRSTKEVHKTLQEHSKNPESVTLQAHIIEMKFRHSTPQSSHLRTLGTLKIPLKLNRLHNGNIKLDQTKPAL